MIKAKKLLALLLALVLMFSAVACGQAGTPATDAPAANDAPAADAPAATDAPATEPEEIDIWAPYEETVELTTISYVGAIDFGLNEDEDFQNNPYYTAALEDLNIQLINDWTCENASDVTTKLNLHIADGDIPDVFFVFDLESVQMLVDAGLAMDITDIYETYASDTLKAWEDSLPVTKASAFFDGRMYAVPRMLSGRIDQPWHLWLRSDWMEALGAEAPTTWDELVELLRLMNKEYGATFAESSDLMFMYQMAAGFGAYPAKWIETENGIEYGGIQPEMKDVLTAYKALYDEGLLDPDFVISNKEQNWNRIAQSQCGAMVDDIWCNAFNGTIAANGPESVFKAYPIPSVTGEPTKQCLEFANTGYIVVSSACENPGAAIQLLNWFTKYTSEGFDDEARMADLQRVNNAVWPLRILNPTSMEDQMFKLTEAIENNDPSNLTNASHITAYDRLQMYLSGEDVQYVRNWYTYLNIEGSSYAESYKLLQAGNFFDNALQGKSPESLLSMGSTLNDILVQGFVKIIVGEEPIEYFDELVATWKSAGGEQVTADMNALYS